VNSLFLSLLAFHFLFLSLHDWIPLGRLNDLPALRSQRSFTARIIASLLMGAFSGLALYLNWTQSPLPSHSTRLYTLILYVIFTAGLIRAWWLPYCFGVGLSDKFIAEYKVMFSNTYSFLPVRNGITVNALHILFHVTAVLALVLAAIRLFR
jgi:hypothetical protein